MTTLLQHLTNSVKHWYMPLIIGLLFIFMGGYIFTVPLETYLTLSVLFSISFLVSGLLDITFSIQNRDILRGWGWYLVGGLLTLFMGIYLVIYPGISILVLPYYVGFTMLFRSFQLLGFAFDMKEVRSLSWGNAAILSILGIIFSMMLIAHPLFTGFSLVTLTATTFIFAGVASCVLAFNLKKLKEYPDKISSDLKHKINAIQKDLIEHTKNI